MHCNSYQNPSCILVKNLQANTKIPMETSEIQNSENNLQKKTKVGELTLSSSKTY